MATYASSAITVSFLETKKDKTEAELDAELTVAASNVMTGTPTDAEVAAVVAPVFNAVVAMHAYANAVGLTKAEAYACVANDDCHGVRPSLLPALDALRLKARELPLSMAQVNSIYNIDSADNLEAFNAALTSVTALDLTVREVEDVRLAVRQQVRYVVPESRRMLEWFERKIGATVMFFVVFPSVANMLVLYFLVCYSNENGDKAEPQTSC